MNGGRWLDTFAQALRALADHRLRTALSVLGITIGIAAVMAVGTISRGGNHLVFSELETFGLNSAWVYRDRNATPPGEPRREGTGIDAADVRAVDGAGRAARRAPPHPAGVRRSGPRRHAGQPARQRRCHGRRRRSRGDRQRRADRRARLPRRGRGTAPRGGPARPRRRGEPAGSAAPGRRPGLPHRRATLSRDRAAGSEEPGLPVEHRFGGRTGRERPAAGAVDDPRVDGRRSGRGGHPAAGSGRLRRGAGDGGCRARARAPSLQAHTNDPHAPRRRAAARRRHPRPVLRRRHPAHDPRQPLRKALPRRRRRALLVALHRRPRRARLRDREERPEPSARATRRATTTLR